MPEPLALTLRPLAAAAPLAVEALLDEAFGPERRGRTAYRLREGADPIADLSAAAFDGDARLVGSLQSWNVVLAAPGSARIALVLVGPVAVAPAVQGRGVGSRLLAHLLERDGGQRSMVLIGDPPYYGRFGFSAEWTGGWALPGPFERHRLLARPAEGTTLPTTGRLEPAPLPLRRAG